MTEPNERAQGREDLAFFGTVTASLSHEINNVLAIVGEFSGLLEDLVATGTAENLKPERLQSISRKIGKQVSRGQMITHRLNRFAHSMDDGDQSIDLSAIVAETIELSHRFAYLKRVQLDVNLPEGPVGKVVDNPFSHSQAVFLCIRIALDAAVEQRKVGIRLESEGSGVRIVIVSADPFERSSAPEVDLALLESVTARIGGRLEWISAPGRDSLVLLLK